jgi:hypothetical protein
MSPKGNFDKKSAIYAKIPAVNARPPLINIIPEMLFVPLEV